MPPLFPVTLALYAVSGTLHLVHVLLGSSETGGAARLVKLARATLFVAFTCHAVDIGWLCAVGQHPMVNAKEAVSFVSWLVCGAYLLASLRFRVAVVGAIVVPVAIVLDLAARLGPTGELHRETTTLGIVHIVLATAGVALFAVAAGGAVVYLLEEKQLKAHKTGRLLKRGAALETLDALNRYCITGGFPLFTAAMVTGAVWVTRLPQSGGIMTPQYFLSSVAWVMYAVLIVARVTIGWRGRRAAMMTLAGFGLALLVLVIYLQRGAA